MALWISDFCQEFKSWIDSNIVETHNVYSAKVCQKTCQKYAQCQYFTYANVTHKTRPLVCFLKNGKLKTKRLNALTSGPKYCPNEYAIMQLSGKLFFSVISDIISDVNSSLICFFLLFDGWLRDIHIECPKQFKWNLYFYGSGQSGPF